MEWILMEVSQSQSGAHTKNYVWSWIIFHNVTSKYYSAFVFFEFWLQLWIFKMTKIHQCACDLRAPGPLRGRHPSAPRSDHLSTQSRLFLRSHFQLAHPLPASPFQCPRSRTATLELGAAVPSGPYVGLTVHWPSRRFLSRGERPAGDPVDSDPGAVF